VASASKQVAGRKGKGMNFPSSLSRGRTSEGRKEKNVFACLSRGNRMNDPEGVMKRGKCCRGGVS